MVNKNRNFKESESYKETLKLFNIKYSELRDHQKFFIKKRLLIFQDWKCGICGDDVNNISSAHLDHNHDSDRIRGVLCRICNHGLGCFKDDTQYLILAIRYLTSKYVLISERVI